MSFQSLSFRSAVFRKPGTPEGTPDSPAAMVFWTYQGSGPRAEHGFIFEHDIGGAFNTSKRVSDRIDWRTAMGMMKDIEAEAAQKTTRVNEQDHDTIKHLQENDTYASAGRFDTHPLLVQEQEQSRLQSMAAAMPKLTRRAKPPGPA